jgi:hypothetical protein
MVEKPKTEVHTANGLPPFVLSGRVSHSSSGYRRVPLLRKSSIGWIWQHDKRTDDYKIIFNLCKKCFITLVLFFENLPVQKCQISLALLKDAL